MTQVDGGAPQPITNVPTPANGQPALQLTGRQVTITCSKPISLAAISTYQPYPAKVRIDGNRLILGNDTAPRLIFDLGNRVLLESREGLPKVGLGGINTLPVTGYATLAKGTGDAPRAYNTRLLGPNVERANITGFYIYELTMGRRYHNRPATLDQ